MCLKSMCILLQLSRVVYKYLLFLVNLQHYQVSFFFFFSSFDLAPPLLKVVYGSL